MKTIADLEDNVRKEVAEQLVKRGFELAEIEDKPINVDQKGKELVIRFGDITLKMPAPSQEAIDSWWKEAGKYIVGGLLTLAGVVVGVKIADKLSDDNS